MTVTSTISTNKYVLYLRISTAKSGGVDSNGIAAQERDLNLFLGTKENPEVVGKFVEVMSGGFCNERPQLEKALKLCRRTNSTLVVQKVDRLSRDVEFIARLIKDKSINLAVFNLLMLIVFKYISSQQSIKRNVNLFLFVHDQHFVNGRQRTHIEN